MRKYKSLLVSVFILTFSLSSAEYSDQTSSSPLAVEKKQEFFATGDLLYWTLQGGGIEFSQGGLGGQSKKDRTEYDFRGDMNKISSQWEPGFRVGIGCKQERDDALFFAYWTHFKMHPKASVQDPMLSMYGYIEYPLHELYPSDPKDVWQTPSSARAG